MAVATVMEKETTVVATEAARVVEVTVAVTCSGVGGGVSGWQCSQWCHIW